MAFIHLGFALYLNHKPADGSPGPITQTWLLVVVALISNIFGIAIDMSLGGAFTQYLWRHLRSRFLKASTINDLFSMRGDIFSKTITGDIASVFKSVKESGAWALLMMTIILWSKPIFSPFISAAITVKLSPATIGPSSTQVPIFDAADVGDGTVESINSKAFTYFESTEMDESHDAVQAPLSATCPNGRGSCPTSGEPLQALVQRTLLDNRIADLASPCGPNCTYTIIFDGPFLSCQTNTAPARMVNIQNGKPPAAYECSWANPINQNSKNTDANLVFTTRTANAIGEQNPNLWNLIEHRTTCTPSRASYTVLNNYTNNTQYT
ncbi:hypothetical protein EV356DRAFT_51915 [Viridothelium virens]|uniref:Uncharacterized protein n=1 Tax=Viridothelium virens TaxID=1048519 RepID=A0A6A6HF99_VIRVR|nr:hypothetical protein EV356DRAFT_51915 [Viridothelium virens]